MNKYQKDLEDQDKLLKYVQMRTQWTNKAGNLNRIVTTQKRLAEQLARKKPQDNDTKNILLSVAEGYDATLDLLQYTTATLQDMLNDFDAFKNGAELRNIIAGQGEFLSELLDSEKRFAENIVKKK